MTIGLSGKDCFASINQGLSITFAKRKPPPEIEGGLTCLDRPGQNAD
jgi:hypothetical protein